MPKRARSSFSFLPGLIHLVDIIDNSARKSARTVYNQSVRKQTDRVGNHKSQRVITLLNLLPIGSKVLYFDPPIASLGKISWRVRRSSIAAAPPPTMQEH